MNFIDIILKGVRSNVLSESMNMFPTDCCVQMCAGTGNISTDPSLLFPTDKASVAPPACRQSNFCQTSADGFMGNSKRPSKQSGSH